MQERREIPQNVLVSVIMPTYNRAAIIARAIKSVLDQTYSNLELIVVDDASTDNTAQVVSSIADPRVKYLRLPENSGVSAARNAGIKKARGAFIAFLDSDDEYLPERLEENLKVMEKKGEALGLVCSDFRNIEEGKVLGLGHKGRVDILWHVPSPSTWFLRKEVFDRIGLFEKVLRVGEDREFLFRFHVDGSYAIDFIKDPLVTRHKRHSSLAAQGAKYVDAGEFFLGKHKEPLKRNKKFLAYTLYRLGKDLKRTGRSGEARPYFLKAFLTYPVKVEYFGKWVKSYFKRS